MPSELDAFQRAFAAAIVNRAASNFDAWPGFAVYRNTSPAAAIEALAAAYPATQAIVGESAFGKLALAYFRDEPPASPVLAEYGANFSDWLEWRPDASHPSYLSDVARIDRLQIEAHIAPNSGDVTERRASDISDDGWMTVVAEFHPATRFRWFEKPTPSIWLALRASTPPEQISPDWRAEGILLTRAGGAVEAFVIDRAEHYLLSRFATDDSVGDAAIAAAHLFPTFDIGARFKRLLQSGAIHQFRSKEHKQ